MNGIAVGAGQMSRLRILLGVRYDGGLDAGLVSERYVPRSPSRRHPFPIARMY